MAKFKVGDIVKILAGSKAGKIGRVESSAPGPQGGEMYHIRLDDGILTDAAERNIALANSRACNGVRSRNAVVAKALNACARNGGIDDFKVGDRVMVRSIVGFTPTDPKPGTVTAIYKSDNRIAVKKDDGGRGLFDASMVTKNACGTARNANLTPQYITSQLKDLLSMMKSVKMDYGKVKENDRSIKKKLTALGDSMREDRKVYDSAPESVKREWDSTYNEILGISPFGAM